MIAAAFLALAVYLLVQSGVVLASGYHRRHSLLGIGWTAITAIAMFALAVGKQRTGQALCNPLLTAEARVTVIDGVLATAVLLGLLLNTVAGWWLADPAAGLVSSITRSGKRAPSTASTSGCAPTSSTPAQGEVGGRPTARRVSRVGLVVSGLPVFVFG